MKRFRLNTLLLLVVIAAMILALVTQQMRANRREAELEANLTKMERNYEYLKIDMKIKESNVKILSNQIEAMMRSHR